MKLLFAIKHLAASAGGAERVLCSVVSELSRRGHDLSLVTFDAPGREPFYPVDRGVKRLDLGIGYAPRSATAGETLRRVAALRKLIGSEKPDVAIGFMHSMYVPLGFALAGSGTPVVGSEHIAREHFRTRPAQLALLMAAAPFLRAITVLSESIRASYPASVRKKMVVVPNPVMPASGNADLGGKKARYRLLNVGRLEEQKDQLTLVRAFARVAPVYPDWDLRIVGEGPLRGTLSDCIKALGLEQRVSMPGKIADIGAEYRAADAFVISSLYEGLGLVTCEAMSYGLPIVGFADCPGTNELVQDGCTGLLAPARSNRAAALAETLEPVIAHADLRRRLGDAGKAYTLYQGRGIEAVTDLWEALLRDVQSDACHGVHRRKPTPMRAVAAAPRVLFVANNAEYFRAHRLDLARAMVARGFAVSVVMPLSAHDVRRSIEATGVSVYTYPFAPAGLNPMREVPTLLALRRLYRAVKPDIVHHLTLKPILYGGMIARLLRVPVRVHSVLGLGHLFNAGELSWRALRAVLWPFFRFAMGGSGSVVIVENSDDASVIGMSLGGAKGSQRVRLIKGSGVEPSGFDPAAIPGDLPLVLFAGRLLKTKGVVEFVEAARRVRRGQPDVRFVVCGKTYEGNPAAIEEAQIRSWVAEGLIEWWGHREDMPSVLGRSTMVVLPSSYGEGVPRILIEAAAAGRPIVTTDSPGCREIVRDGVNGVLVPCGDSVALALAVERLLGDPDERGRMGREGRRIVEREFSLEQVILETFAVYEQMLAERGMAR